MEEIRLDPKKELEQELMAGGYSDRDYREDEDDYDMARY